MAAVARRRNRDLVRRNAALVVLPDRQNPLEHLSEGEVRDRFRFYPETIIYLTQTLRDDLERPTLRRSPLPVLLQVCIALRFLATGSYLLTIGDCVGSVSKASVSRVVHSVITSIIRRLLHVIAFPHGETARRVKEGFYRIAGKCCVHNFNIKIKFVCFFNSNRTLSLIVPILDIIT